MANRTGASCVHTSGEQDRAAARGAAATFRRTQSVGKPRLFPAISYVETGCQV
ncbi:hypothetical protein SAMN05444921_102444 [Streptomyces wuyuanensis]|uniref:Uncharacterized protein n=1 Tax=Streptomyces wuyuanensis TaxID=1196353 RepID=A0A1G9PDP1_9ACTN|nr:hypothetical protein SAMN05444921_102444 [Streptomyces wuyuanensis]